MREAKAAGAVTSFDLNFREKLWKIHGGDKRAVETIGRIVENVDVLVGNEEDLQKGLGNSWTGGCGEIEARFKRLLRDDGTGGKEAPQGEGGGDDAA